MESFTRKRGSRLIQLVCIMPSLFSISSATPRTRGGRNLEVGYLFEEVEFQGDVVISTAPTTSPTGGPYGGTTEFASLVEPVPSPTGGPLVGVAEVFPPTNPPPTNPSPTNPPAATAALTDEPVPSPTGGPFVGAAEVFPPTNPPPTNPSPTNPSPTNPPAATAALTDEPVPSPTGGPFVGVAEAPPPTNPLPTNPSAATTALTGEPGPSPTGGPFVVVAEASPPTNPPAATTTLTDVQDTTSPICEPCSNGGTDTPKGGPYPPKGKGSKSKGGSPKSKGGSPKDKGGSPKDKGGSPKGKGGSPKGKGGSPKGKGGSSKCGGSSPVPCPDDDGNEDPASKGKGGYPESKGNSPTPTSPTPTSPTPTSPTPSPTTPSPAPQGTKAPHPLDCEAVRHGTAPKSGRYENLVATLHVTYYPSKVDTETILKNVDKVMNCTVRLGMLGCPEVRRRRLEEANMTNAVMDKTEIVAECQTDIKNAECVSLATPTKAYYESGDPSQFQKRLDNATQDAIYKGLFMSAGVKTVSRPSEEVVGQPQKSGLSAAETGIIAGAAVALLLLGLLLLRRRRSIDDESVVRQIKSTDLLLDDDMTHDSSVAGNKARVVGENDSLDDIFDGIDDSHTLTSTSLGGAHPAMDVHVCQSSLCEACEQTKQNGISFVKIGAPSSPPRIPDDASRSYAASNTISL